jgi:ribonuclease HII
MAYNQNPVSKEAGFFLLPFFNCNFRHLSTFGFSNYTYDVKIPAGIKYVIGIDEAGRGPLAGPVAVGACLVSAKMTRSSLLAQVAMQAKTESEKTSLKKLYDSKKLSAKRRELWFAKMCEMKLDFSVTLISNKIIDTRGISFAIRKAMADSLRKLQITTHFKLSECLILLDGGLKAPKEYVFQKTIIKGDEKEFAISLASIAAKVTRDAHMRKLAQKYSAYGFEVHKGYGTAKHIAAIKKEGITPIHRRSFLRNIV